MADNEKKHNQIITNQNKHRCLDIEKDFVHVVCICNHLTVLSEFVFFNKEQNMG